VQADLSTFGVVPYPEHKPYVSFLIRQNRRDDAIAELGGCSTKEGSYRPHRLIAGYLDRRIREAGDPEQALEQQQGPAGTVAEPNHLRNASMICAGDLDQAVGIDAASAQCITSGRSFA
jgi:hypothetical protein